MFANIHALAVFGLNSPIQLDGQCRIGIRLDGGIALLAVDLFIILLFVGKIARWLLYRVKSDHNVRTVTWKCLL